MDDEKIDEYVQLGQRNAKVLELARNWCAHLEVEVSGGVGLLEQMTGLPIGGRMMLCKHQRGSSIGAMDLEHVALHFYDENCVGCPHRSPVRLPNLTQIVTERDRFRAEAAKRQDEEREIAARAFAGRAAKRQVARDTAEPSTAGIIDLIGELDAAYGEDTHARLVKLATTVPQHFTSPVQAVLLDVVGVGGEGRTRAALEVLRLTGVSRDDLVKAALGALGRHDAVEIAAAIVADHVAPTHRELVGDALPAIFMLAAPVREPFSRELKPKASALERVYALFPGECERMLGRFFATDDERTRVIASGAWEVLMRLDGDIGPRLLPQALASLSLRDDQLGEIDGARRAVAHALAEAMKFRLDTVDELLQSSFARGTGREAILNAYAEVCGSVDGRRGSSVAPQEARRLALTRMSQALLDPMIGSKELRTILYFLRDEASKDEELIVDQAPLLLGALALLLDRLAELKTSTSSLIVTPDDPLSVLEKQQQHTLLGSILNALSSLVGLALRADRAKILPLLTDILDTGDTKPELRSFVVRMLSGAATDRAAVADLLPYIYSALTDGAQQVRAAAVASYGAIAKHGVDDLPPLLNDLALALLMDPYVIVHRGVAKVLTEITLPEPYRATAAASLAQLVEIYARTGGDDYATREVIEAFMRQHTGALPAAAISRLIEIAQGMQRDQASRALLHLSRLIPDDVFIATAVEYVADPELSEHDRLDLLRVLMRKDPDLLSAHTERLIAGVLLRLREQPWPRTFGDDDFLDELAERFMRAENWTAARHLLNAAEQLFGESTRTKGRLRLTSLKLGALAVEEALDVSVRDATAAAWSADLAVNDVETAPVIRARFEGISALVSRDADRIKSASMGVADAAESIQDTVIRGEYIAFARLLDAMHRLVAWDGAVRSAEREADRHRTAAVLALRDLPATEKRLAIADLAERIISVGSIDELPSLLRAAAAVRLPLPLSKDRYPRRGGPQDVIAAAPPRSRVLPAVAFARFEYEGRPLEDPQVVTPRTIHDVTIDITLSDWPEGAERVVIDALSIVPRPSYDMPSLTFTRPDGQAPYHWRETAKFVIRDAQSLETGPLEFQYRAYVEPDSEQRVVVLEGQRNLNLYAYDAAMHPQTGFAAIDQKLLAIRTGVRRAHVPETDIAPFMRLMTALGSVAGRAIAGDLFPGGTWPEKTFQRVLADKLRTDPRIGSELEEHPSISGGTTDLSLQRVRLELKVEVASVVRIEDALAYSQQEAQYVAGSDRRLGVICILDTSEKHAAPGLPSNDIDVLTIPSPTGGAPMMLGVVILRGNLRRPSDYSR